MSKNKIIWSVDPFTTSEETKKKFVDFFKSYQMNDPIESIEPVHILGLSEFAWIGNMTPPNLEKFLPVTTEAMDDFVDSLSLPNLSSPKVLMSESPSKSDTAKKLIEYAHENNATAIIASTHAREGLNRFFLGSFAEDLILYSDLPLLLINPTSNVSTDPKTFLLPVDLNETSKKFLEKFTDTYQGNGSTIVLYNKIPHPVDAYIQPGVAIAGGGWVTIDQFLNNETEERKKELESWAAEARKKGFEVKISIDDSPGYIADGVLDAIEKNGADLVALASKAGSIETSIFGSTGRQVTRGATCPIWISHPK